MLKATLRFVFEAGAGGCLWAGNDVARSSMGSGPLDAAIFDLNGRISQPAAILLDEETQSLIRRLDDEYASHLNPIYPGDPSLWTQARCDRFNNEIDQLFLSICRQLQGRFAVVDEQQRLKEDPSLPDFLAANPRQKPVS